VRPLRSLSVVAAFVLTATALGACGSDAPAVTPPGSPGSGAGEPAALAGITAAHNDVRAQVGVGPLTWDAGIAATAAAWAATCTSAGRDLLDHNPSRNQGTSAYFGENIYASSGSLQATAGVDAVRAWASEAQYYDYASNSCAAGQVCGHYTQVVWRATTRIGCAVQVCPGLRYPTNVVCDYAPGGNYVGERPY
jgi:pathogenesis-related protein 1